MAVLPAAAAAAYRAAAQVGSAAAPASIGTTGAAAGNFSEFLTNAMKESIDTIKQGEKMAAAQTAGKADLIDVVNAVNAAELSLDTVVAVRDKVVAAYQSIMNMPI